MFLYTNNELSKKEIQETISFIIASKIFRNKFIQGIERSIHQTLQNIDEEK